MNYFVLLQISVGGGKINEMHWFKWVSKVFFMVCNKGPVLKSFMRQVAIIEAHGVPWKF